MSARVLRWFRFSSVLVLLLAAAAAARAQDAPEVEPVEPSEPAATETAPADEAEATPAPSDRAGRWEIDVEQWVAQPTGLQYVPVVVADPNAPGSSQQISAQHGTEGNSRLRLAYGLRDDLGTFTVTYWSHDDRSVSSVFTPSSFGLGEALMPAGFAGAFDDGTADAVRAVAETKTRDLRLDFSRQAFATRRANARWFVGIRQVDHNRSFGAEYFALVPNLPFDVAFADLQPAPDTATQTSQFSGRGPEFGFDLEVPVGKRFRVTGGVSTAILRGDVVTEYFSISRAYAMLDGGTVTEVVSPQIAAVLASGQAGPVEQITIPIGVQNSSRSATAQVLETSLAVRYRFWREFEAFLGLRATRYADVATEVRPIVNDVDLSARAGAS
jgi:hypothetical protein